MILFTFRVDKLYFLECDVGQTELTPPGCISLHCITEPLLGKIILSNSKLKKMFYEIKFTCLE